MTIRAELIAGITAATLIAWLASGQASAAEAAKPAAGVANLCTIPVMILRDGDEPRAAAYWEKQIRERIGEASKIFEQQCRVRFQVVAVGEWTQDPGIREFEKSIAEFERKVRPGPARLAIGFTGRYRWVKGELHMGGTRGPLASHILIRDALHGVSEPERLEVLVHELGHFLGAVHTTDTSSVMRPKLGDGQSRAARFHIGFDAANARAMTLIGAELRQHPARSLRDFTPSTKTALREIYATFAKAMPQDNSVAQCLAMLRGLSQFSLDEKGTVPLPQVAATGQGLEILAAARTVLAAIVQAAHENQQLPLAGPAGSVVRRTGDELTAFYIRRAAAAARKLPARSEQAFLLAIAVALDDSTYVRDKPLVGQIWEQIEPAADRTQRLAVLGVPTLRTRHDSAQHFSISAALVVLVGPQAAEAAGVYKELSDAQPGGSGFSFADLCADLAGVTFANRVLAGTVRLETLAERFTVTDYMPSMDGLREDMPFAVFLRDFGGPQGDGYRRERARIIERIEGVKGYKK